MVMMMMISNDDDDHDKRFLLPTLWHSQSESKSHTGMTIGHLHSLLLRNGQLQSTALLPRLLLCLYAPIQYTTLRSI